MKNNLGIILVIVLLVVLAGGLTLLKNKKDTNPSLQAFASCIKNSGAKFYGAWWCPHCNEQKDLFAKYDKDLPYIECSDQSRKMLGVCTDAGIQRFPTWIFPDGEKIEGVLSFDALAKKTACPAPTL